MIQNPKDYTNPFSARLVESLKRAQREREQRAAIYEETHEIVSRAFDAHEALLDINGKPVSAVARGIILAGRRARGEIPEDAPRFSDNEHGRFAKAVINAGRRRRGEEELK